MLKKYVVKWEDLKQFGYEKDYGYANFNNTVDVTTPKEADFVYLPIPYRDSTPPLLSPLNLQKIIQWLGVDERRVVLFDVADDEMTTTLNPNVMFIRCNVKPFMRREMPRTITWPWPTEVESFQECWPIPEGGFKYDVGYHAWTRSSNVRKACQVSLETNPSGLSTDMACYDNFTGYIYYEEEGIRRRKEFRRSMRESRLSMCPLSIWNVFPYRFTEALAAKRVPVLICDGVEFPWADRIPYDQFMVRLTNDESLNVGPILKNWLSKHSDEEIIKMGELGYSYWNKWLNRDKWADLMPVAIEERLRKDGLL
jgi:hypothetical protein